MRHPPAVHHVDAARETALRELGGVVVGRLLVHAVQEYLDPVVPLRKREEHVGRRVPVKAEMRLRGGEVGVLERAADDNRRDLLDIGVEHELAAREHVAERLFAPHVASAARDEERRGRVAVRPEVDALRIACTVGLIVAIAAATAPPAFAWQDRDFRDKRRRRRG